jgi:hypothetical protein
MICLLWKYRRLPLIYICTQKTRQHKRNVQRLHFNPWKKLPCRAHQRCAHGTRAHVVMGICKNTLSVSVTPTLFLQTINYMPFFRLKVIDFIFRQWPQKMQTTKRYCFWTKITRTFTTSILRLSIGCWIQCEKKNLHDWAEQICSPLWGHMMHSRHAWRASSCWPQSCLSASWPTEHWAGDTS